jgi:hypothetical protein
MPAIAAALLFGLVFHGAAYAQGRGAGAASTARAAAPRDFTGSWLSVVTEHWHWRMMVPPKGDFGIFPLNAEGQKIANAWDPAKDRAEGNECKAYGAAGIMRVPGRLHIQWADDNTLQMDIDSGTQTRVFRFGSAPPRNGAAQWQGYSAAMWDGTTAGPGVRLNGQLRVTTTNMRPGYLAKNGVPYSESARLEEYYETFAEPNGDKWLVVTTIVTDQKYLARPHVTTYPFKKIPDKSGWDPTPCRADKAR